MNQNVFTVTITAVMLCSIVLNNNTCNWNYVEHVRDFAAMEGLRRPLVAIKETTTAGNADDLKVLSSPSTAFSVLG